MLGANVLSGVWLNLSFWYKREERTSLALWVTFTGLLFAVGANLWLVPRWGYYGAAWARLISEAAMVAVSYLLMRRLYPVPYAVGRMAEFTALALVCFFAGEAAATRIDSLALRYAVNTLLLAGYLGYLIRRERIDVRGLAKAILKRR